MSSINDALSKNPSTGSWTEPQSANNKETPCQYPFNNITQTRSGHSFELDDTPKQERVRIQHRSGTFIEMHPNGDEVHKIIGKGYEIVTKGKNVEITGVCNITINGDSNIHVTGNKVERIDGNYTLDVNGDIFTTSRGSGGMFLNSEYPMKLVSGAASSGAMYLIAKDHIYVSSDMEVAGDVACDSLNAKYRVNAGTGMKAGTFGLNSEGPIIGASTVTVPVAVFGVMDAVLMTDVMNSGIYNHHVHPAPHGSTGIPTTPFFGI